MRYLIIEDGKVANAAEAEAPLEQNWVQSDEGEIGDLYDGAAFTKPPPDLDALAMSARFLRNQYLVQSDWTQVADAPVDQAVWAKYRQALRDVPAQPGFPLTIVWPTEP
jgi:hypothetical protein